MWGEDGCPIADRHSDWESALASHVSSRERVDNLPGAYTFSGLRGKRPLRYRRGSERTLISQELPSPAQRAPVSKPERSRKGVSTPTCPTSSAFSVTRLQ